MVPFSLFAMFFGAFDLGSAAWDGLSEIAAMARALGVRVEAGPATANDAAILVLFPATRVDAVALAGNRPNSRFAVFDDFGGELSTAGARDARGDDVRADLYWRGIRSFPVARVRRGHPTTTGVRDVVMNRPAPDASRRMWQSASAIMEFAAGNPAVVASGNLVLGADPSLFINRMLAFGDNRRFVANLFRWLSLDGRVPVKLVVGDAARGIALLHRPGAETPWTRPIAEVLTDVNLELGHRAEPVVAALAALAIGLLAVAALVASRWMWNRRGLIADMTAAGGSTAARKRLAVEMEDAWFDLGVRLKNVRTADWIKGSPIPPRRVLGKRIGVSAARVEAAHAVLDRLERLPRVERLLPPPVGVASRRAEVDRR